MMKENIKYLAYFFLAIALIGVANAVDTSDVLYYLTLDTSDISGTTAIDVHNGYNCTITGAVAGTGIINEDLYFDGNDDKLVCTNAGIDSLGSNDFSINFWYNGSETTCSVYTYKASGTPYIAIQHNCVSLDVVELIIKNGVGTICSGYATLTDLNDGDKHMVTFTRDYSDCSANQIWIDGVNQTMTINTNNDNIDGSNSGDMNIMFKTTANFELGQIDEYAVFTKILTPTEVTDLYNSGNGFQYPFSVAANDTTPPSITNLNQDPSNVTILNALLDSLYINATITDNVKVDNSSIYLIMNTNGVVSFTNGILKVTDNVNYTYTNATGSLYNWYLSEDDYFSHTENIDADEFLKNTILNHTLTNGNQWVKIRFKNVSNNHDLIFSEIMDTNSSDTAEYIYCNSNYTTGNPLGSASCTQFYVQTSNDLINTHSGGKVFHRVMVMSVNSSTGMLNDVYVTPISYILKRGSSAGETYYYINNNTGSTQTTLNNGNTWSNQGYTVNAKLFFIDETDSFNYSVCAYDNSSNLGCSASSVDYIDFPKLPPSNVLIDVPVFNASYNNTLSIEHSQAFSVTGQSIVSYTYQYLANGSTGWNTIYTNTYPNSEYTWDISNRRNGFYHFRVIVLDDLNYTSITETDFYIANEESLNTQLLTEISDKLDNLDSILVVIMDLGFIILYVGMTIVTTWLLLKNKSNTGLWQLFLMLGLDLMLISLLYDNFFTTGIGTSIVAQYMSKGSFIFFMVLPIYRLWSIISVLFNKITRGN